MPAWRRVGQPAGHLRADRYECWLRYVVVAGGPGDHMQACYSSSVRVEANRQCKAGQSWQQGGLSLTTAGSPQSIYSSWAADLSHLECGTGSALQGKFFLTTPKRLHGICAGN